MQYVLISDFTRGLSQFLYHFSIVGRGKAGANSNRLWVQGRVGQCTNPSESSHSSNIPIHTNGQYKVAKVGSRDYGVVVDASLF